MKKLLFGIILLVGSVGYSLHSFDIKHKGYIYKTISSPITGKIWLDRNIEAYSTCSKSRDGTIFENDEAYIASQQNCFGRLFQRNEIDKKDICPIGFRVPTFEELSVETIYYKGKNNYSNGTVKVVNKNTAFQNFLKLPVSGMAQRYFINTLKSERIYKTAILQQGEVGYMWSNTIFERLPLILYFDKDRGSHAFASESLGATVRCIKD